jgi:hypothetical protein
MTAAGCVGKQSKGESSKRPLLSKLGFHRLLGSKRKRATPEGVDTPHDKQEPPREPAPEEDPTDSACGISSLIMGTSRFPHFSRLVDKAYPPKPGSIESHLFARARKTVNWTDDRSRAVTVIRDKESILDGKSISLMASLPTTTPTYEGLAVLPPVGRKDDLIVLFKGSRVPFLVRPKDDPMLVNEWRDSVSRLVESVDSASCGVGLIVGECLVNDYVDLGTSENGNETVFIII